MCAPVQMQSFTQDPEKLRVCVQICVCLYIHVHTTCFLRAIAEMTKFKSAKIMLVMIQIH